jgi:hypothetical protein
MSETKMTRNKTIDHHHNNSPYSGHGNKSSWFPILEVKKSAFEILPIAIQITHCLFNKKIYKYNKSMKKGIVSTANLTHKMQRLHRNK